MHVVLAALQTTMNNYSHNVLLLYYNTSQAFIKNTLAGGVMEEERVWGQKSPSVSRLATR